MEVLQADALTIKQNGKTIINQISFTISNGEQWAITGPSGSGKTTLLKALAGRQSLVDV
jgi:ABC-type molybdenum transport system ATPase subunit/photorepair protein PhrA